MEIERTLVLTKEKLLDTFEARSTDGASHTFDWFYHNAGKLTTSLALEPFAGLPAQNGYQHLTGLQSGLTAAAWHAAFSQPGATVTLDMAAAPDTRVVTGEGLGPDLRMPVPFVMVRRHGTSAKFEAVYSIAK